MKIQDYNGEGEWSLSRIRERYVAYCAQLNMRSLSELSPREHRSASTVWIYPVMNEVIRRMKAGDLAAFALGVDLIEDDAQMPMGKILKSNTARVLRQNAEKLDEKQMERIRHRVVSILLNGPFPHELKEYVKLLKTVGLGSYRDQVRSSPMQEDARAKPYYHSLAAEPARSGW